MLVTLSDMKTFIGETGSSYDIFLENQIKLISETVEAYCRRNFKQQQYVQTFYREDLTECGFLVPELTLFHFPLVSVDSIVEKKDAADSGVPVTDYRVHGPTAKLIKKRGQTFFNYGEILEVTYTAGYPTVPSTVLSVVYSLVQERYNKKKNGIDLNFGENVQSISIPGVINVQYDFSLNTNERKSTFGVILGGSANILDFYRSERAVIGTVELAYVGNL